VRVEQFAMLTSTSLSFFLVNRVCPESIKTGCGVCVGARQGEREGWTDRDSRQGEREGGRMMSVDV
jgi:hypothetical protein